LRRTIGVSSNPGAGARGKPGKQRRTVTAVLSLLTIGAALSFGVAKAVAAEDVSEDQIVRALAPAKNPLT